MKLSVLLLTIVVLGASKADFTFQIVGTTNPEMQTLLQSIEGPIPEISFVDETKAHLSGICMGGVDIPVNFEGGIPMTAAVYCNKKDLERFVEFAVYRVIDSLEKFEKVLDIQELTTEEGDIIYLKRKQYDMTKPQNF